MDRIIIHADFDSFFASCAQQDRPELRRKPVGVVQPASYRQAIASRGGDSGRRSVIIGSSKEAKTLGISTGMLVWEAKHLCPQITIVPAHFDRYVEYARRFDRLCSLYSDRVEIFSIDELFLDVTQTAKFFGDAQSIAEAIKTRVKIELGSWFTVSLGIAPNKMLAKLASASRKPDGLVVVDPHRSLQFLDQFELWHICGIGNRIQHRLNRMGIFTIKQLRQTPERFLIREFGIMGSVYRRWAHGIDQSPVAEISAKVPEKSFGNQVTLAETLTGKKVLQVFLWLSWQVAARLRAKGMGAKTVSLSLRGKEVYDHQQFTPGTICTTAYDLYEVAQIIYEKMHFSKPVRFVGISASNLVPLETAPLSFLNQDVKQEKLAVTMSEIADTYGPFYLRPASLLGKRLKETEFNGFTKRF